MGTTTGRVLVYDQDTRGIVRDYKPHKCPCQAGSLQPQVRRGAQAALPCRREVTCLAWAATGVRLVSGSADSTVVCHNLATHCQACRTLCARHPSRSRDSERALTAQEARFPAEHAVAALDANPADGTECVASYTAGPPAVLQFQDESARKLPCITEGMPLPR